MATKTRAPVAAGRTASAVINDAIESTPLSVLREHPLNPRQGDVGAVVQSIEANGFFGTIVAQRSTGYVLAGNHRMRAARQLGFSELPVVWVDVDDERAKRILLADNRTSDLGSYDDALLSDLLKDLAGTPDELRGTGYDGDDLDELLASVNPPPAAGASDDAPAVDEQGEPDSRQGQVYELGPHRLVCGDSTDSAAWDALLGSERLRMVWTDPPYGVAYTGRTADALEIENDRLDDDGLAALLRGSIGQALARCGGGAAWYVAAPSGRKTLIFANVLDEMGLFRQRLVWAKDAFVLGHSDYHYKHEDIYYGFAPGEVRLGRGGAGWFGDNAQSSILEFDRPKRNGEHPTMKPVELVRYCIRNSSKPGWLVGDLFGGSGTTLLAAASEGRVARLIELDPRYCDVIRRRWTRYANENGIDPGTGALDG